MPEAGSPASPVAGTTPYADHPPPSWQRITGGTLVMVASVEAAVAEAFYVPLRVGTVLVPVAVLVAVLVNATLPRLMYDATRSRLASAGPVIGWLAVVLGLSVGRPEGDVVVPGSLVGLALLFAGSAAAAFGVSQALVRARGRPGGRPGGAVSSRPSGTGTGGAA
ncbi:MAG: hypothetical protein HY241_11800 [Actinobacteria bacterium]|nr:hypothetical protein [Actinomycetota bacterium]